MLRCFLSQKELRPLETSSTAWQYQIANYPLKALLYHHQIRCLTKMPVAVNEKRIGQKRRGDSESANLPKTKRRIIEQKLHGKENVPTDVLLLEERILESRQNYNEISKLLDLAQDDDTQDQNDVIALVALCRIFCRLMAAGNLVRIRGSSANEATVVDWLKQRYQDYKNLLIEELVHEDITRQSTALTLLMRLLKEEKVHLNLAIEASWRTGVFTNLITVLIENAVANETRTEFVEKYVKKFDDVRFYAFECLAIISPKATGRVLENKLVLLATIDAPSESNEALENFFAGSPSKAKHELYSWTAHRRTAQKAWMGVLSNNLDNAQRKTVLELMSHRIAPWFLKVELLMDFLTDSFDMGGSTSLMALSGLFYLIQSKNLDYPQFYQKLYSLLDSNLLHSKHRSRFFRLLDTFLASTHLPAALVASFIKRMSRLALHASPSGIVVIVPWIYNLLKNHPSCTFMIHRNDTTTGAEKDSGDPFRMGETDPMASNALQSSLWEIHTLQTHYHPNVATIAKIISEQFTKQAYNLEDFLDHSYGTVSLAMVCNQFLTHVFTDD